MAYPPKPYIDNDPAYAAMVMAEHPFAILISAHHHVTHLPLLHRDGALLGHLAIDNPALADFANGPATAIFAGPHAYVSAQWYPDPAQSVPTWNYVAVHAKGPVTPLPDDAVLPHLADMARAMEGDTGWSAADAPDYVDRLRGKIVAVQMQIQSLTGYRKLSREKSPAIQKRVIDELARAGETATANAMRAAQKSR